VETGEEKRDLVGCGVWHQLKMEGGAGTGRNRSKEQTRSNGASFQGSLTQRSWKCKVGERIENTYLEVAENCVPSTSRTLGKKRPQAIKEIEGYETRWGGKAKETKRHLAIV